MVLAVHTLGRLGTLETLGVEEERPRWCELMSTMNTKPHLSIELATLTKASRVPSPAA